MSTILGVPLHEAGFELVAIDMPGYGQTRPARNYTYSNNDWVDISRDFIEYELQNDPRPIVLYSLSAGGMLASHAAASNRKVKGVLSMTFLDQRDAKVRKLTSHDPLCGLFSTPFLTLLNNRFTWLLRMPMWLVSKMSALTKNLTALQIFMKDPSSAAPWATVRFMAFNMSYTPSLEPDEFDVCSILLTERAEDKWRPLGLSELFLSRVKKVKVSTVMLENAGNYPLEDPGLFQMADAIIAFLNDLSPKD